MSKNHWDCAVVGSWHLAFITAACLSKLGRKVVLVNPDPTSGEEWKTFPELELSEPGLQDLIADGLKKKTLDFQNGITADWTADQVWLAIDTPVNDRDEADVSPLLSVAEKVAQCGNTKGPYC